MHISDQLLLFIAHNEDSLASSNKPTAVSDMFKEPMVIAVAYAKLCNHFCSILKDCNIPGLRVAVIKQADTPDGVKLKKSVKNDIKSAQSIDELLLAFDDPSCCSWLNIRLLEVLANCTSQNAVEVINAYKNFLFSKKLETVLPRQHEQSEERESFITTVCAKVKIDPDKITVGNFMEYYQHIEKAVLDLGKQILNIKHLKRGCLEIIYTIPVYYSFNAYKMALHNQHKFYAIDLVHIEIDNCPMIFDPWLFDMRQLSAVPHMQFHYNGKSL